jgi:O-antigen ligase
MAIAPLLTRAKGFPGWQKLILMAGASAGIVAIIVSLARGSWLALVCSLLLLMAFGWMRLPAKERKSYFVSVGAVLVLMGALLAPFSDRIYERLTGDDEGAAMIRIPLMENAINMIKDNALVGVGLNNYRATMTKYDETGVFVSQIFPNPVHNVFMHVTAEIGVPGGIIFCLMLLLAFSESVRAMLTKDRLLFALGLAGAVSIIAFSISGVKEMGSLGSTRGPMRTCFLLLGTIMAVSRVRRQQAADIYSVRGKDA